MIKEALTAVIKPVGDFFTAREKRKAEKQAGITKLELNRQDNATQIELTDAEWEAVSAQVNGDTWKDEYVTVTMTAWIWVALYGALRDEKALAGVQTFLDFCTANGVEVGWLTGVVVTAAVGLKVWRGR